MTIATIIVLTVVVFVVLGCIGGFDLIDLIVDLFVAVTEDW